MTYSRALFVAIVFLATISVNLPTLAREVYRPQTIDAAVLSSARDLFSDARVLRWAQTFRDGRHAELAEDVATDLAGSDPHPFASHVWFNAQYAQAMIRDEGPVALPAGLDGEKAEKLSLALRIFQRERQPGNRDFGDLVTEALALDLSDYWALNILVWRAQGADLDAIEARAAMLWPDTFGIAWAIGNGNSQLDATGPGAGAAFRLWLAQTPGASAFDRRLAVQAWLDWTPNDTDAQRRVGYLLEATHDFEQALEAFRKADAIYPFLDFSAELIGRNLARLGRFEELERVLMEHAARREPPPRRAATAAVAEIDVLRLAGELGRARARALTALETWPEDAGLRVALARVVMTETRPAEAVDLLLPVALADNGHRDAFEFLARALLDAGRHGEAIQATEAFAATGHRLTAMQINDWARALRALGRPDDAVASAELLARDAPRTTWALGNVAAALNAAGRPAEAFDYLAGLLRAGRYSDSIATQIIAFGEAAGRVDDARTVLEEAARAFPHGEELWARLADISPDPMAVLAEARTAAPRSAFPWRQQARRARGEDFSGWREALAILDAGIAALESENVPDGELSRLFDERSLVRDGALEKRLTRDPREIQAGLADLERARALGLPARDYWLGRYLLLGRLGESIELAQAVVEAAALHERRAFDYLFREDVMATLRVPAFPFAALHAWVEREPRNSERLLAAANRHSLWGGSPVVALALIQRAERADPNAEVAAHRGRVYNSLGLYREGYEALYARATSVADSDRYIDWKRKARRNARSPGNTLRSLDLETMQIVLRRADGIEEERRYHPQTGKLTYLRVGAAWVELDFIDGLEFSGVRTGGGRQALITYDDIPFDPVDGRRVTGLVVDDEAPMSFSYSHRDEIAIIEIDGVGRVEIDYDDDGEIVSTRSFPVRAGEETTLALSLVRAFQSLTEFTRLGRERAGFANLPFQDPELDLLRRDFNTFGGTEELLALAEGLVDRRAAHPDHAAELHRILDPFIHKTIESETPKGTDETTAALHAIRLWHAMMQETLAEGLDPDTWAFWTGMRNWAMSQNQSGDPPVARQHASLVAVITAQPLRPLSTAGWLRSSFLTNPGLWRHHRLGSMVPPALAREATIEAALIRGSGDIVVGTRRGLSVMQRGFFEWLPFDSATGLLNPSLAYERLDGASAVQALHEDEHGALWIGTRAGLMRINGDYTDPPTIWRAGSGGMPEGGVAGIVDLEDVLVVGGPGGLALIDRMQGTVAAMDAQPVSWLRALGEGRVVVGRQDRVEHGVPGALELLATERLDDVTLHDGRLLAIRGTQVLDAEFPATGLADFRILPEQETIDQAGRVFGFTTVPIFADETALGVRTDQGISLYRNGRFEHLRVPGRERIEPATHLFARGTRLLAATPEGVSVMEEAQARLVLEGDVRDMLSRPDLGMTLIATGWSIEAIAHDAPFAEPMVLTYTGSNALASAPDGAIIANDFGQIVRLVIEPDGNFERTALFSAFPSAMPEGLSSEVRQILVARDGTIWVLAGPSVFRLAPGAQAPDELSVFLDPERFGASSDMLSRLIETSDGHLWLVASNEGHRSHRGESLRGGLFAFDGDGFRMVELEGDARWFLTGYTPLPDRAIIGTTAGFAVVRDLVTTDLGRSEDASYRALRARLPALHIGTDGIDLGDGLFLFGTAGGVVGLREGMWFYPERLNWMLPAQEHAAYGARAIRQLAADPMGRIYMATDFGVTVYDPRGAGPEAFLIDEGEGGFAFAALESRKMEEVREILLDALPGDSDAGRRLSALREMRRQIAQLEAELDLERSRGGGQTARIERQVLQMRQRDIAILADLERNEPELFALVQVNPLDLQALRRDLPPGTVVIQYLPGRRTLFINVMSRETQEIHRIDISAETLEARVRQAVEALAAQARGSTTGEGLGGGLGTLGGGLGGSGLGGAGLGGAGLGGSGLGGTGLGGLSGGMGGIAGGSTENDAGKPRGLVADLAFLYDHLLRPVEHQLEAFDSVLIAPTGALNYLPLGALVRDASGPRPRYAVEDTIFSKIPNLYAIQAMLRARPSSAFSYLVLGDPDGTLPHARLEASEIAEILGEEDVTLLVGDGASYEALADSAAQARFLHFAMHGKLDHREPRNSYLLLADGRRLTLPQIMTLPLGNAELVFLSACETGLGVDGLEHRTIAQAFNHAGAPTVVAAHWEVSDAATRSLSKSFYGERVNDESSARSLARAQRAMLAAGGAFAQPGFWAGFSVYGKP